MKDWLGGSGCGRKGWVLGVLIPEPCGIVPAHPLWMRVSNNGWGGWVTWGCGGTWRLASALASFSSSSSFSFVFLRKHEHDNMMLTQTWTHRKQTWGHSNKSPLALQKESYLGIHFWVRTSIEVCAVSCVVATLLFSDVTVGQQCMLKLHTWWLL